MDSCNDTLTKLWFLVFSSNICLFYDVLHMQPVHTHSHTHTHTHTMCGCISCSVMGVNICGYACHALSIYNDLIWYRPSLGSNCVWFVVFSSALNFCSVLEVEAWCRNQSCGRLHHIVLPGDLGSLFMPSKFEQSYLLSRTWLVFCIWWIQCWYVWSYDNVCQSDNETARSVAAAASVPNWYELTCGFHSLFGQPTGDVL